MKFLVAFVYDDGLKDKVQAEKLYKQIARDHPEHVFGQNAAQRLKTLHMTDEELIEHFEKLNSN